jgi:1,4-dihydroxy-2-naphthoate octaprenyltransferase
MTDLGFWRSLAVIRRPEFYVVELTIFGMPVLVSVRSISDLLDGRVLEGLLLFFLLYSMGDIINCLADRDVDRMYKVRLSRAVHRLGVKLVSRLVLVLALASTAVAVHLSWVTGQWGVLGLVLVGMFLGIEYSIGPIHFKSRGIAHLACLWLLLYFLPMLCAALLVGGQIDGLIALLAASYATVEMGVILVNTSEDLPEDRAMGLRTTTVALGLRSTLVLASAMVLVGGLAFTTFWVLFYRQVAAAAWAYVTIVGLVGVCVFIFRCLSELVQRVDTARDEESAIRVVKAHGALVPVWATLIGWLGLVCGALPLLVPKV